MERTHVSKLTYAFPIMPTNQEAKTYWPGKPRGWWYECDADWQAWCIRENEGSWLEGHTLHRVVLGQERIKNIRSAAGLMRFTRQWGEPDPRYSEMDRAWLKRFGVDAYEMSNWRIRWADLAEKYDGIEIAPHPWSLHLTLMWFNGWDCASGVIWRPKGVRVVPIGPVAIPPRTLDDFGGELIIAE